MDLKLLSAGITRATAWVACLFPYFAATALAQGPGTLDLTFGTGGSVITPISGFADGANAVVVQPDGKLVLAGRCLTGGSAGDFCLVRYHADGTLDTGFGIGGKVTTSISSGEDAANALALQPDGKLVAAGACLRTGVNFDFCLARYNSDGTLDSTFGSNGVVSTPVGDFATGAKALVIQPDGMIVAGGSCYDNPADLEFCLVRYDANGALDATYGGGAAIVEFDDMDDSITALTLLPDGKVVAAGMCGVFGDPFAVFHRPQRAKRCGGLRLLERAAEPGASVGKECQAHARAGGGAPRVRRAPATELGLPVERRSVFLPRVAGKDRDLGP